VKAFLDANVKLEHHCDLLNEKSPYKHVNETMDSPMFESLDIIVPTRSIRLKEKNSSNQSYSLSSIDSIAN